MQTNLDELILADLKGFLDRPLGDGRLSENIRVIDVLVRLLGRGNISYSVKREFVKVGQALAPRVKMAAYDCGSIESVTKRFEAEIKALDAADSKAIEEVRDNEGLNSA